MEQEQRLQVPLIHENISLWEQGVGTSSYPSPGSDILIRPFSFKLPSTLLPSCEYGGLNTYVCNVRYFVQVVGRRPGKLKLNERHLVAFPVLPALASGAKLRETFQQGWRGPWRATAQEKNVRRGIWGDHSHVKVTVWSFSPYIHRQQLIRFIVVGSARYRGHTYLHIHPIYHHHHDSHQTHGPGRGDHRWFAVSCSTHEARRRELLVGERRLHED